MRFRVAQISVLALCLCVGLSGTALAVTGLSGNGSAGVAQYKDVKKKSAGGEGSGDDTSPNADDDGGGAVLGTSTPGGEGAGDAQAGAQVQAASADSLPFTGLQILPMLLGGVAVLMAGLVVRRRFSADAS